MAKEIERKFLIKEETDFKGHAISKSSILQGYVSTNPDATVRVRIKDDKGYVTIKSRNVGSSRNEWEYEVPVGDIKNIIEETGCPSIEKTRYMVPWEGKMWEVDVFHGRLEGLIMAEIELESTAEQIELPPFVGKEVTDDVRYYNSNLSVSGVPT